MIPQKIQIIKTGGTIEFLDSDYEHINNALMKLDATIDNYLANIIKPHFDYDIIAAFSKDSRDISEQDRENLVELIDKSKSNNVLITHGTVTMRETAEYIEKHILIDKKVILTGAMVPLVGFASSDAGFNLGFAMGSLEGLQPGVYLSMNGGVFAPKEVTKNSDIFRFE